MAQNFLPCDRDQELLLPPSLREWLPEDHLAWFVLDSVAALDLEPFYASYRRDGWGAAAHDPQMMVAARLLVCDRGALVAWDRASLPRGRRLPRDHCQPGARPRHRGTLPGPPRGGAGRAVRSGARPVR